VGKISLKKEKKENRKFKKKQKAVVLV